MFAQSCRVYPHLYDAHVCPYDRSPSHEEDEISSLNPLLLYPPKHNYHLLPLEDLYSNDSFNRAIYDMKVYVYNFNNMCFFLMMVINYPLRLLKHIF